MAILDIRVLGDPILRETTVPVTEFTDGLQTLIDDMFETMYAAEGIGLAAPQIGRSERLAVIDLGDDSGQLVIINPEITPLDKKKANGEEGCLSIPNLGGWVERPAHIRVNALDRHGQPFELEADGLLARCLQHETDHLFGRMFVDYLSLLKRRAFLKEWDDEVSQYPNFIRKLEPVATPMPAGKARRHSTSDNTSVGTTDDTGA